MALPNPDLWYEFENESLLDSSGNGYHAENGQPSHGELQWSSMDVVNGAVGPQQKDDGHTYHPYALTPYTGWCSSGKIWTCSVWVKTQNLGGYSTNRFFECGYNSTRSLFILDYYSTNNRIYANFYGVGGYFMDEGIDEGSVVMLTCRYNGDEGVDTTADLFLDGNYAATVDLGGNLYILTDIRCILGGFFGHNNYSCGCLIGDFRIYNSALTDEQISELYQSFLPPPFSFGGVSMKNVIIGG